MSDSASGANQRKTARASIELKVEYKRLNTFLSDYTKNIGKGGTFIRTKSPLDVGTRFVFKLYVPGQAHPFELHGVVRWLRDEGDEPGMGIEFVFESDQARRALHDAVEKLMRESLGDQVSAGLMGQTRKS